MKKIKKTHPPKIFLDWLKENKNIDCSYDVLVGRKAHTALKEQLIKEQGYICAYTGREIHDASSHVEHLKPQNKCVAHEDVEYRNLLACFPVDGGDKSYGYGAPVKGGWWQEELFVSPLAEECERRFTFSWSGKISANPPDNHAAKKTIEVLNLDHDELVKIRRKAIKAFFGFTARSKTLSPADAKRLLGNVDKMSHGRFMAFCFVLKPLLEKYVAAGAKN